MPKYLVQASYTAQGIKGLLSEGGTGRRAAVEEEVRSCGGTVEWMYFAFGDDDLYVVVDMPDHVSMLASALAVRATGAVESRAIPLIGVEDVDAATRKRVDFRPPGA
ncbi:GYD domain-containing protein [Streptomyces sp. NPDC006368]|uniref:GYD domain-containing protein n=1 Tax=Streptomyces sp. NPDC006368 TaxID=3156760 RepID=UPI0033B8046D